MAKKKKDDFETVTIDRRKLYPVASEVVQLFDELSNVERAYVLATVIYCMGQNSVDTVIGLIADMIPQIKAAAAQAQVAA